MFAADSLLYLAAAILLGGISLLLTLLWLRRHRHLRAFPYQRRPSLLTAAELDFLRVLEQACAGRWRIHVQVRLADVLQVQGSLAPRWRMSAQNRINSKHVDFVLCEPGSLAIVCAIELDDRSHLLPARQARDAFVNEAFRVAGLPLLRVPVRRRYDPTELAQQIQAALEADSTQRRRTAGA